MFRKTCLTVLATAAMLSGTNAFADPPTSGPFGQGTIFFHGTVTNSPCNIAPGDDALKVEFGQVSYRALKTADATTASQPIVIHLTDCSFDPDTASPVTRPEGLMSKVKVTFTGDATSNNKGYVNTGSATNVAVQLLKNDNSTPIPPGYVPTDADAQQLQPGNNELRFFARLLALGAATPGEVKSQVTYTLTYL
ncbi:MULTISPECIES: fimbrial protein [Enterobacteriaceae]|uniref:Fimbrial protein domain-containing protein n=2 Tax=Enterobacteriaceae TaxID=543 RepID=E3GCC5_ENTLS|nr:MULTISPECIES: fimbrial protein [Enterobacteriaceae]ECU9385531.1 fimbrial protein StdA [Salmonella enterica subsp. enterica serovar Newport]HCB3236061.1 fimbrial protein [Citrobacter amalonaticus]HCK38366.1 fimbrial protein StdA [Shigella sp.]ADO50096.1 Fimbrial protein domain-containing protein [[Enterobacter] lignolyticus SCF1]EEV9242517.1 fimbrial protein StdA [Escherichia coli]